MPHQCLKCGKIFEDGSPEILKGCPQCGGKKFFFTNKPLSDKERKEIELKGEKYESIISTIIEGKEKKELKEEWISLEPKKVKEILANIDEKRKSIAKSSLNERKPESISIKEVGDYDIDVKKLLDGKGIVIQKDGSYLIHLPSVFEEFKKIHQ